MRTVLLLGRDLKLDVIEHLPWALETLNGSLLSELIALAVGEDSNGKLPILSRTPDWQAARLC
jgi:hypothetical protein